MTTHPHIDEYPPEGPSLVLFMGLQASGKSSFYRLYLAHHVLISKDLLRNNKRPQRRQMRLLRDALAEDHAVVIDNTNPTPDDRAPLIAIAQQYDAPVIGYYFRSKLSECLARNAAREGRARVPDVALYTTAKKLQLPTLDEGFAALYHVSLQPKADAEADGAPFSIAPWQAEDTA